MESRRVTHCPVRFDVKQISKKTRIKRMCIHRRSFLHSVLQNSCLNRQQRRIKANTVNRTVSWSWSQTAQATRQVLLRLQVKQTRLSGNASSDLKTLLITQPLLPRFTSRRHPNPKSKTTNLADYLFCQTVRQATSKSSQAHQLVPRFTSLRRLNWMTKIAEPYFQGENLTT